MKTIILSLVLCIFLSCTSMQPDDEAIDVAMYNLRKELKPKYATGQCSPWEEIIKNPEYQKLSDGVRQKVREKYFDACSGKKDEDQDYFKERYKFYKSALETEKKAGLGNYLNCISGDCQNGKGALEYFKGARYKGEFKDGKRDGNGTYTWSGGEKYVGQFKDDLPNGEGTETCAFVYLYSKIETVYTGEWKDGKKHGKGLWSGLVFGLSLEYKGQWENDKFHGQGTMIYEDGIKYTGQWKSGYKHGEGTMISPIGEKYEGQFKDDKFHGNGTFTWPDGSKYVGQFKDGKKHGKGTFTYLDGSKYVGQWENDYVNENEKGTFIYTDGGKYSGQLYGKDRDGEGTMIWPDGAKYTGRWKYNKRDGKGTMTYPGGLKYTGGWEDGKKHGKGILYDPNGKILKKGTFQNDEYIGQ